MGLRAFDALQGLALKGLEVLEKPSRKALRYLSCLQSPLRTYRDLKGLAGLPRAL